MPLYTYKCKNCGFIFNELVSSFTTIICPSCKSKNVDKQSIYENNFQFKGSGFYETDYKKSKK